MIKVILTTTAYIPGKEIKEYKGLVSGNCVVTRHIFQVVGASIKAIFGGEVKAYSEIMHHARNLAVERMVAEAKNLGANAVISIRLVATPTLEGATETIAYGTAVIVDETA